MALSGNDEQDAGPSGSATTATVDPDEVGCTIEQLQAALPTADELSTRYEATRSSTSPPQTWMEDDQVAVEGAVRDLLDDITDEFS